MSTTRNRGKSFERKIEAANRQYLLTGEAQIIKTEVQNKFINGKMIYTKKGPPDFIGMMQGGTFITFDAKSTQNKSYGVKYFKERPHQLTFMQNTVNMGGIAFYLIEYRALDQTIIYTPNQVMSAMIRADEGGRKSITPEEGFAEVTSSFSIALDYLAPFRN